MPTIRQRGTQWQAIVRVKKHGTIVHQESNTFPSERLAKDWAERLESRLKKDGVPSRQLEAATLGQLLMRYGQARAGVKPLRRTVECELAQLVKALGSERLSTLTSETFTKFALRRSKEGAGPAHLSWTTLKRYTHLKPANVLEKLNRASR